MNRKKRKREREKIQPYQKTHEQAKWQNSYPLCLKFTIIKSPLKEKKKEDALCSSIIHEHLNIIIQQCKAL